ncbi:hypothetical protein [Rhodopseudomonas palustris]|uniref:hypothetical protein n=1 Tax=Rhodopseudomonas palustris TaxID=1076 RepID=UPI0005A20613|nr:hypothetical protein [Rhodopseudomonas palustris]
MSRIVMSRIVTIATTFAAVARDASLRARGYGPLTALPLPAGYPVGGLAGEQWRVTAFQLATDQAGMVAVLIVAWVLTWSRARGGHHG